MNCLSKLYGWMEGDLLLKMEISNNMARVEFMRLRGYKNLIRTEFVWKQWCEKSYFSNWAAKLFYTLLACRQEWELEVFLPQRIKQLLVLSWELFCSDVSVKPSYLFWSGEPGLKHVITQLTFSLPSSLRSCHFSGKTWILRDHHLYWLLGFQGFPGGTGGKESTC